MTPSIPARAGIPIGAAPGPVQGDGRTGPGAHRQRGPRLNSARSSCEVGGYSIGKAVTPDGAAPGGPLGPPAPPGHRTGASRWRHRSSADRVSVREVQASCRPGADIPVPARRAGTRPARARPGMAPTVPMAQAQARHDPGVAVSVHAVTGRRRTPHGGQCGGVRGGEKALAGGRERGVRAREGLLLDDAFQCTPGRER